MNKVWLVNGAAENTVNISDRGLAYGDGLFETIAVRDHSCRFLTAHLQRLTQGCERLGIPVPNRELLTSEVEMLASGVRHGALKIIVTRGSGPRGYRPPSKPETTRIVGVEQTQPHNKDLYRKGIRLRICNQKLGINPTLAGLKTLNRLENVLARAEWDDAETHEGLLSDHAGKLVSGTMSNVFLARNNTLCTPDLSGCGVAGIMRGLIIEHCTEQGIPLDICALSPKDARQADEIFVCNSNIGIWPVAELATERFAIGPVTQQLMAAVCASGVAECAP